MSLNYITATELESGYKNHLKLEGNKSNFHFVIFSLDKINQYEDTLLHLTSKIRSHLKETVIKVKCPVRFTKYSGIDFIDENVSNVIKESQNLSHIEFENEFILEGKTFKGDLTIENSIFKGETSFSDCKFHGKTRFRNSLFHKSVDFYNSSFHELVDFFQCKFFSDQQFYHTDFYKVSIFSRAIFFKPVQFLYNKVSNETIMSFESTELKQSLDISRANFWCTINFWNANVNYAPKYFTLFEYDITSCQLHSATNITYQRLKESYRIIKDSFKSVGNITASLPFQSHELYYYWKEVRYNNICREYNRISFRKTFNEFRVGKLLQISFRYLLKRLQRRLDLIVLLCNWMSNDFGTNWFRGLIFSFTLSAFWYYMFLLALQSECGISLAYYDIYEIIKSGIQFSNLTFWRGYAPLGLENFTSSYSIIFIGRIFIAYGFYQTIQAFRKFGKN